MLLALSAALHPPVRSKLKRTARSYRRKNRRVPEVRLARGALSEGNTGNGAYADLFGALWALALTKNGLILAQLGVGGWQEVAPLDPLPDLPRAARHIALAFDQAARPVIAWNDASGVFVRQWDAISGSYVVRGPFSGCDPVLIQDATVNGNVPNSDVLLGHLTGFNKDSFVLRPQRELYAVVDEIPVPYDSVLDAAFVSGFAVRFLGSSSKGAWSIASDLYPYLANDNLTTATATQPGTGKYLNSVLSYNGQTNNLTTATATQPSTGQYLSVVIPFNGQTNSLTTATGTQPNTGQYLPIVLVFDGQNSTLTTAIATQPSTGQYLNVIIPFNGQTNSLTTATATQPIGGSYVLG